MCSYIVIHTPTLKLESFFAFSKTSWLIELKLRAGLMLCLLTVFVKLLIIFITLWHSGVAVSIVASQQEDPRVELTCLPVLSLGFRLPPTTHRCVFRPVALLSPPTVRSRWLLLPEPASIRGFFLFNRSFSFSLLPGAWS